MIKCQHIYIERRAGGYTANVDGIQAEGKTAIEAYKRAQDKLKEMEGKTCQDIQSRLEEEIGQ